MGRHLSDKDVAVVVEMATNWNRSRKITWQALLDAVSERLGFRPARQTLHRKPQIRLAIEAANRRLSKSSGAERPIAVSVAIERIGRLEAENDRLKAENAALLEQFMVWQYNAYARGMTDEELNRSLPVIDRGRTD